LTKVFFLVRLDASGIGVPSVKRR